MALLENHKFIYNFDYLAKLRHFFHFFGTSNGNYIIFQNVIIFLQIYMVLLENHKFKHNFDYLAKLHHFFTFLVFFTRTFEMTLKYSSNFTKLFFSPENFQSEYISPY